jgi:O-antigen ligase
MGERDRLVHRALMTIIVLAPLPFASNRPWAWSLLALVVGAITCAWAWWIISHKAQLAVPISRLMLPASLYLVVCVFAAVQALPMDFPAVESQFWMLAQQAGIEGIRPTISISPVATWTALMRLVTHGLVFWLVLQTCRPSRRASGAVLTIGLSAAAYGAYGILVKLSGSPSILWFDKWAYGESLTGTFINRNSFATFLGLGLLCVVTHLSRRVLHTDRELAPDTLEAGLFSKGVPLDLLVMSGAAMCLMAALLLTQSRAGVLSSILAVIVFLLGVVFRSRRARTTGFIAAGSMLLLFVLFFHVSGEGLNDRLSRLIWTDADLIVRAKIYGSTLNAIADHPLLGLGYGTFEDGFKIYRSEDTQLYFDKAHNTYLELAMELGIPAATALVLALVMIVALCLRGWSRRQRLFVYPWLAFCATLLVGLHALVDFSLQIPSVAIQFAAILAIGCAQSWSTRTEAGQSDRFLANQSLGS